MDFLVSLWMAILRLWQYSFPAHLPRRVLRRLLWELQFVCFFVCFLAPWSVARGGSVAYMVYLPGVWLQLYDA